MKNNKSTNIKTSTILLILAGILFLVPIFTFPSINNFFNFSNTGQIGDTIGGITAPFINGLAAVLVFLAFKEQIKANEIFKSQEKARMILDQISLIQEDKMEIERLIPGIISRVHVYSDEFNITNVNYLNKLTYFFTEIRLTNELMHEYQGEKDFFYRKLSYLYIIRYKDLLNELNSKLQTPFLCHNDYKFYILEIQLSIQELNENFEDVGKFKRI